MSFNFIVFCFVLWNFMFVDGESNDNNYVLMHIAKTGGVTANSVLAPLLDTNMCTGNRFYGDVAGVLRVLNPSSEYGVFTRDCHILTYEAKFAELERWLSGYDIDDSRYRLLSIVRNPVSHWFSAWQHMYNKRKVRRGDDWHDIATTFEGLVEQLEQDFVAHYNLRSFQMNFFGTSVVSALRRLRNTYWFGLTEEMTLSYGLLQCQVFGEADLSIVKQLTARKHNVADNFKYVISADLLKRLQKMNVDEMRFYELTVAEFWMRVRQHGRCLAEAGFIDPELL